MTTTKDETVTILLPTYNRASMLMQAIESIINQTYTKWKMIIYDDGSTDNTRQMVASVLDLGFPISYIISEENSGISFARNRLLDLCETRIACWQDSDDVSHPMRLERQMQFIKDYEMVYTAFIRMERNPAFQNYKIPTAHNFANASCMFKVDRSIRFNLDMMIAEDNDWRHRMKKIYTTHYMKEALYYVRFHQDRLGVKYRHTRKRNLKEEAK